MKQVSLFYFILPESNDTLINISSKYVQKIFKILHKQIRSIWFLVKIFNAATGFTMTELSEGKRTKYCSNIMLLDIHVCSPENLELPL